MICLIIYDNNNSHSTHQYGGATGGTRPALSTVTGAVPATETMQAGEPEIERETIPPKPEDVADRVYQIMVQELRRDRERSGRW